MKTQQIRGPFEKGWKETFSYEGTKKKFVQIGIELGNSIPFELSTEPEIKINDVEYKINNNRVLEWDNFEQKVITIEALKDLDAYTLIDIAYE